VWEGGIRELFVGGGSTSATSVLPRRRYPLDVLGYLFTLRVGGLAVAGPYSTSTLIRSYPAEPGCSLSATCDLFGSLQLGALRAIPLALWPNWLLLLLLEFVVHRCFRLSVSSESVDK